MNGIHARVWWKWELIGGGLGYPLIHAENFITLKTYITTISKTYIFAVYFYFYSESINKG